MKDSKIILSYFIFFIVAIFALPACEDVDGDEPPWLDTQNHFNIEGINLKRDDEGTYRGEISADRISFTVSKKKSSVGVIAMELNGYEESPLDSIKVAGTLDEPIFKYFIYEEDWGKVYYTTDSARTITHITINKNETGNKRELYFVLYGDQGFTFSDALSGSINIIQLPSK